ncbi:MAG: hypothetical protein NC308_07840 [Clostridium sp.]|nr:hypothetical protein [Clostridium sp.]
MFFDRNGNLKIDELVAEKESFRKILEDRAVTECEIREQADKVLGILSGMESRYSADQLEEINELLAEASVLYAVYQIYSIQSLNI